MNRQLFFIMIMSFVIILAGILYSCDGGNGSVTSPGTVALYLADDLSLYSNVTATINRIQLVNTGMGASCDVLTAPVAINIAELHDVMQLVAVAQCVPGNYNRVRIEFDRNARLISGPTGTGSPCTFASYREQGQGNQPKTLNCDPGGNRCILDINGAVNVLASGSNKQVLDFDLKNFEVSGLGGPACAMTMMVSPISAGHMHDRGYREAVTGLISGLSITNRTFDLTRGSRTFSVLYSGITNTDQPEIDTLLQRAQDDRLRTKVTGSDIDLANNSVIASAIVVKAEGTVSDLVTDETFTLRYGPMGERSIGVDYSNAEVDGTLMNGSWVDVKLIGRDRTTGEFLADKVEVGIPGFMTED